MFRQFFSALVEMSQTWGKGDNFSLLFPCFFVFFLLYFDCILKGIFSFGILLYCTEIIKSASKKKTIVTYKNKPHPFHPEKKEEINKFRVLILHYKLVPKMQLCINNKKKRLYKILVNIWDDLILWWMIKSGVIFTLKLKTYGSITPQRGHRIF